MSQAGRKRLFLVVDDEPIIRTVISEILHLLGFDCHPASNGALALELLAQNRYDIVIADIVMPAMHGLELLRQIRSRYPAIDVLLISGFFGADDYGELLRAGAADFLTKPFQAWELEKKVLRLLREQERSVAGRGVRKEVCGDPEVLITLGAELDAAAAPGVPGPRGGIAERVWELTAKIGGKNED